MSAFETAARAGASAKSDGVDLGPINKFMKSLGELEQFAALTGTAKDTPDLHKQIKKLRVS